MRIALAIEQFDLAKGGQERSTLEIAQLLTARGLDVAVVTAQAGSVAENLGTRIIDLNLGNPSRAARYMEFVHGADKRIAREGFDLVHAITPIRTADVYQPRGGLIDETFARNLARRRGLGWLVRRAAGPNPRQRLVRKMERELARRPACQFLAVSEYVRQQCREHLGLPDERIHTIFNGVDLGRLAAGTDVERRGRLRAILKVGEDQLVGTFAATNFKLKGLDAILDSAAWLRAHRPDVMGRFKFLVSGPDKVRTYFNRAARLGLGDTVIFLGPTRDMGQVYAASDFLIHPTWYDPCSRVVLEALACGLPAITTRYNGAGEVVRREECGVVLDDPGDAVALADVYLQLLDTAVRQRWSQNARAAREKISMESHVEQLIKFYGMVKETKRGDVQGSRFRVQG